ncbi:hypothetical protein Cs7R123_32170 [Catellatospora sp. TT07R-123]|uniref:hypothetical protein n=1 Tax=Catellatospora sp. TT07R-123 TaxID=2733863 RepID=UPI001B038A7A|nr:hypothetical protein [Catellatospora sp. TT07R-123]GHJ45875.1 hypothetical protein Cs7R123_32170 [Catellatospora sp. TT07R-123]
MTTSEERQPRPQPTHPVEPYKLEVRVMPSLAVIETIYSLDQARGEACISCGARGVGPEPSWPDELVPVGRERRFGQAINAHRDCVQTFLVKWFEPDDEVSQRQLGYYRFREQIVESLLFHYPDARQRRYERLEPGERPSTELIEWEAVVIQEAALAVRFGVPDEQ